MTSEINSKEQDAKALAFLALEQYKAQLALIESCIRAGRYNWAMDTLKELPVHGRVL